MQHEAKSDWADVRKQKPDYDFVGDADRAWQDKQENQQQPECGVQAKDFVAYMPQRSYIFRPTGDMWPATSVNSRVPEIELEGKKVKASEWIDKNCPVEQMTWAPGMPPLIRDKLIREGGWVSRPGCSVFNLYREPNITPRGGNPRPWVDHVNYLFGVEADHIIKWLAHRVQRPGEKINHALVLGGNQGIGKDTLLEPVKQAIGPWNFAEVSPQQMLGRFNGFSKSVILRVSEARDLGDQDRFTFYDHLKTFTAAPPDVLRVDEKHTREYAVMNVVGVIITTNHKSDGIYLPADDRRHFVAWCDLSKDDFNEAYWTNIWAWFAGGGFEIVADYLANLDLSEFNPKKPPEKTEAFWEIVNSSRAPENAELADAIDEMGTPPALTLRSLSTRCTGDFGEYLRDRRNSRKIPHRLEECGYVPVRNGDAKDGLWKVSGHRQAIYARQELSIRNRLIAAARLASGDQCSQ